MATIDARIRSLELGLRRPENTEPVAEPIDTWWTAANADNVAAILEAAGCLEDVIAAQAGTYGEESICLN